MLGDMVTEADVCEQFAHCTLSNIVT